MSLPTKPLAVSLDHFSTQPVIVLYMGEIEAGSGPSANSKNPLQPSKVFI
jgi:hypothetical protein